MTPGFPRTTVTAFAVLLLVPMLHAALGLVRGEARPDALGRSAGLLLRGEPTAARDALRRLADEGFALRDAMVRARALLLVHGLGASSHPDVVLGEEGWAYLRRALRSHRRAAPLTPAARAHMVGILAERARCFDALGATYVVAIAPDKATIHPEAVPAAIPVGPGPRRLDQVAAALRADGRVPLVDLRPVLRAGRAEGNVYDPLGTHWNDRGAFLAQRALVRALAVHAPDLRPLALAEIEREIGPGEQDLARLLGLEGFWPGRSPRWRPRRTTAIDPGTGAPFRGDGLRRMEPVHWVRPGVPGPRVAWIHDSFALALAPFLVEVLPAAWALWPDVGLGIPREALPAIEAFAPDLVLHLVAERHLEGDVERVPAFYGPATGAVRCAR